MEVINYKGENYDSGATLNVDVNFTDYSDEFEFIEGEIDDYIFDYQRFSGIYPLPIPLTFIRLSNKKFKFYFNKAYETFVNANITSYNIYISSQKIKEIITINFKLKGFEEQVDSFSYDIYYRPFYFNGALLMSRHDLTDYNEFISNSGNTIMDENTEYCELFYSIANGCSYKQDDVYKLGEVKLQLNDNTLTVKEPFRSFNELDFNNEIDAASAVYGIREPYLSNDVKNIDNAYTTLLKETGDTNYDDYRDVSEKHGIIFYLNETDTTNTNIILESYEFTNKDNAKLNEFAYFTKGPVQVMSDDKIVMKSISSNFNVNLSVAEKEIMGYESFSEIISTTVANVFFPKTIIYSLDNVSNNYKITNNLDVYGAKFFRLGSYSMSDVIQSLRYTTYNNEKEQYDGLSCRNDFRTQNESGAGGKEGWDSIFTVVASNENGDDDEHLTSNRLIGVNDTCIVNDFDGKYGKTKFIMAIYDIYTENYNDVVNGTKIQWQVKHNLTPKDTSRFSVIKIYKGRQDGNQIIFE